MPQVKHYFDLLQRMGGIKILSKTMLESLIDLSAINPDDPESMRTKKTQLRQLLIGLGKDYDSELTQHYIKDTILLNYWSKKSDGEREHLARLLKQGLKIDAPEFWTGATIAKMATRISDIPTLIWAVEHGATIYSPSHNHSPFSTAVAFVQPEALEWLLTQFPFAAFSDEDHRKLSLIFKQIEKRKQTWAKEPFRKEDLTKIKMILTQHAKSKAIFEETHFYEKTDDAVGGVILIKVKGIAYTLLVGKSESDYFPHLVGSYCGPGGLIETDESFETAFIREVREETGLSIHLKHLKFPSVAYEDSDEEQSLYFRRQLLCIDLGSADSLPDISAEDDAVTVDWVPLSQLVKGHYQGRPILRSNILLLDAAVDAKAYSSEAVKRALYCENVKGKTAFEKLAEHDDLQAMGAMIAAGVPILETRAIALAAAKEKRFMVEILLDSLVDINQRNSQGATPLLTIYRESKNALWANEIMTHYKMDWRICHSPATSLIFYIFTNKDYEWMAALIKRKDTLPNHFFDYLFKQCLIARQPGLLDLLIIHYPKQSKKQLAQPGMLFLLLRLAAPTDQSLPVSDSKAYNSDTLPESLMPPEDSGISIGRHHPPHAGYRPGFYASPARGLENAGEDCEAEAETIPWL